VTGGFHFMLILGGSGDGLACMNRVNLAISAAEKFSAAICAQLRKWTILDQS
jgi:hypothetical protein